MVDVVVTALLVSLCCVVYLFRIPCLCICYVNNGLISVSPSTDLDEHISFPCERKQVLLLRGLSGSFRTFIQINLTVSALTLTCRFQVNFFPSTSACFSSSTNFNREVHYCELLVEFCSLFRCIR
jgi:hypothetical protein